MELYIAFGILIGIAVSAGVAVCWMLKPQLNLTLERTNE
jgi:hypothetical protein